MSETVLSFLLRAFPGAFREKFGAGMLELMLTDYGRIRSRGRTRATVFLLATAVDVLVSGFGERLNPTWISLNAQERMRRRTVSGMLEAWIRDVRHGARSLSNAAGFTVVVVATLALAIGATTAIFSVVDAVLLRGLPYPDADRLVVIRATAPGSNLPEDIGVPDELYVTYRENATLLKDVATYGVFQSTTRADDNVERLFGSQATPSLFTVLGASAALGRLPTDEDEDDVVVISHWLWTSWFGADSSIIGRSYTFANATRTVIGVMTPEFRFPDERVALWVPWRIDAAQVTAGGVGGPSVIGRLVPGTDHAGLTAQLAPLARSLPERYGGSPNYARIMERYQPVVRPFDEFMIGDAAQTLWILLVTVGIVLVIACMNVANLFAVRTEGRLRDLAVRRAMGSGRAGLVRAQMAEALLLATVGGALGVLIAWAFVPVLVRIAPDAIGGGWGDAPIPGLSSASLNGMALLFTAGVSILVACAIGLAPAIRFSGVGLLGTLRQSGRGIVGRRQLARDTLVVLQTASALVLLVGSALLVRSFMQLSRVDPGYDTRDIFTFQIAPDRPEINDAASSARFHHAFMDRLAALPGVESVGVVATLPLDEGAGSGLVTTEQLEASGAEPPLVRVTGAGGDYFQTMGIELLRGRFFERIEELTAVPYVIISNSAANLLWPGEDPLGQRVKPVEAPAWFTVVGVVEDVLVDDLRESPAPMVYLPRAAGSPAYVVRSARARTLGPEIRAVIREVVPESPMYRVFTMEQLAARSMARLSFTTLMLVIAAGLALILGALGIYGVLSYQVTQRTQEIGVRMALGAEGRGVRRMVVAQGGLPVLIGIGIGVVAAVGLARFIESLLFGVQALDPWIFVGMSAVMLAVALLASYLPARRASLVDPAVSLRAE